LTAGRVTRRLCAGRSLPAVVAGDLVYNQMHMLTALADAAAREAWIASIDADPALDPDVTIAGTGPGPPFETSAG
jgi:hypothetical protein